MAPHSSALAWKSHGQRSLVGCSPWGREESDTTERLHFHFSLSCIGEGNGSPLQCSCLENPRDGGAWWAAVYGVAQSWTRLKRLSSSSTVHGPSYGQKKWCFTIFFNCHGVSKHFHGLFIATFFTFLSSLWIILLTKMAPKHTAQVLSSVPKRYSVKKKMHMWDNFCFRHELQCCSLWSQC